MEFNPSRAKEAGIDTGMAVVGAVAGLAVSNKLTALIAEKSPNSTMTRYVPAALLLGVVAAQAFDIVPSSKLLDSALQGVSVVTGMQTVRELSGANTAAGMAATTGIAALVNQYVPALTEGVASASASAAAIDAAAVLQGLGAYSDPTMDFTNPAVAMLMAGREQQQMASAQPQYLGAAPSGPRPQVLG